MQHPRPHGGLVDGPELAKVEDLHPVSAAHARMQDRTVGDIKILLKKWNRLAPIPYPWIHTSTVRHLEIG
ncbi:uncharacterized protein N7498_003452 [Penicillium cinerascens]|uniref:Uncharacterized protein n=1 Tax=Penicillium cinerascens TaxID=70096 RepID=A0A9W9T756_9EURO|nr:uncharacterized protein N7498_003452 [Penicillium cinerascens]KAJ5211806.1 hypothetical protein N7498_003452 [Penicillium cinerascens]